MLRSWNFPWSVYAVVVSGSVLYWVLVGNCNISEPNAKLHLYCEPGLVAGAVDCRWFVAAGLKN